MSLKFFNRVIFFAFIYGRRLVMMNKEQFLASGLLEQYALGLTSMEETQLVEDFMERDPEIYEKLQSLQAAVEEYASKYAIPPPRRLKRRILSEILADEDEEDTIPKTEEHFIRKQPPILSVPKMYRSSLAAVFITLLLVSVLLWRQKQLESSNKALAGELNTSRRQFYSLEQESKLSKKIFGDIEEGDVHIIHLWGTQIAKDAHVVVYWNKKEQQSYVKLIKMPSVPSGKQFQIWADVAGKMVSLGLLDNARFTLQNITYLPDAASLNITIEPIGGSKEPSVRLLVANGKL